MKTKKILVTGGSGLVGKHLQDIMPNAIYISSKDFDLTNELYVSSMFKTHNPTHIIHLSAIVGGIIDNINKPYEYFSKNVLMNTMVVDYALKYNVDFFMGCLSTCIYPDKIENYPIKESVLHDGIPALSNLSYAYSKRMLAVQIDSLNKQYNKKYSYIIPSNLYGEYDKFGDNSHYVASLIKKIIIAKKENKDYITLFGSGKPLRQFIHAKDLAKIIKYCIDNDIRENFNVATPENYSIDYMARIALKSCDAEYLQIRYDKDKPDGQFRKDVCTEKMNSIIPNFQFIKLEQGIKDVYNYLINNNIL